MDSQFNNVNTTLEPNQKWAGKYDVVVGYVTILINVQSDQNCTVNIKQSDNRANFDFFESIPYVTNAKGYERYQVYVNSAYALVEVTNTSNEISNLIVHTHFAAIGKDASILEPQIVSGSVSVSNLPEIQQVSGNVTVDSITAPLPAGTNKVGAVAISGIWDDGYTEKEVQATMVEFNYPLVNDRNVVGMMTTMNAEYGKSSVNMFARNDGHAGGLYDQVPVPLGTRWVTATPYHDHYNALHTWVNNFPDPPAVQVVAGHETDYIGFATTATNIPQVYADGIPGVNVTGGWSYTNTLVGVPPYTGSRNKINWYLYNSATPDTDFSVSQISNVYAVINQKSTLGSQTQLPYFVIYTRPDSGVNNGGTFYKNKLTFGGFSFVGTMGMMLLYTGDDPVGVHPEITGANRYKLEFNTVASTATLASASGEGAYLASLHTDSDPKPDGTRNFVFSEFSMMWDKNPIVIPISQNQVQVKDTALNTSVNTLVNNFAGITITSNKLQVGGSVSVSNLPTTQEVSGSVSVSNFPDTQPVSGSVSVSNLPATQAVSGSVSVSNLPTTQAVSGTFWQTTQPVSGTFWQTTQPVSGTVAISNFPEGGSNVTVVSALPAGTNAIGSVTVSNFPEGGSEVSVSNFPATQAVSGTVAISNFPEGGSEVSVVSALPTGSNVIGGVNINTNNNSQVIYAGFAPQFTDSYSGEINITPYRSVDVLVQAYNVYNADTHDGITLNVQVSPNTNDWFTLTDYSLNFKGQTPPSLALNDVKTNAPYIRLIALNANNPSSMTMGSTITVMAKY